MSTVDPKTGRYLPDSKLEGRGNQALLDAKRRRKHAQRLTEREFLRAVVEEFSSDDAREVMQKIVHLAKAGDKDAWAFLGRYCLGGGKVSLQDVVSPPMIRRTR